VPVASGRFLLVCLESTKADWGTRFLFCHPVFGNDEGRLIRFAGCRPVFCRVGGAPGKKNLIVYFPGARTRTSRQKKRKEGVEAGCRIWNGEPAWGELRSAVSPAEGLDIDSLFPRNVGDGGAVIRSFFTSPDGTSDRVCSAPPAGGVPQRGTGEAGGGDGSASFAAGEEIFPNPAGRSKYWRRIQLGGSSGPPSAMDRIRAGSPGRIRASFEGGLDVLDRGGWWDFPRKGLFPGEIRGPPGEKSSRSGKDCCLSARN